MVQLRVGESFHRVTLEFAYVRYLAQPNGCASKCRSYVHSSKSNRPVHSGRIPNVECRGWHSKRLFSVHGGPGERMRKNRGRPACCPGGSPIGASKPHSWEWRPSVLAGAIQPVAEQPAGPFSPPPLENHAPESPEIPALSPAEAPSVPEVSTPDTPQESPNRAAA